MARLILAPWPEGPDRIHVPVAAGISLARSLSRAFGVQLRLKWPNDLLADRKRTAGILVEGRTLAEGAGYVVVGRGLNVGASRADLDALTGAPNHGAFQADLAAQLARSAAADPPALLAVSASAHADAESLRGDLAVVASAAAASRTRLILGGAGFATMTNLPGNVTRYGSLEDIAASAQAATG